MCACGANDRRAEAPSCLLGPELKAESRADVAWANAAADSGAIGGSMGGGRQQGEAMRGNSAGGAGAASCFLGPEL